MTQAKYGNRKRCPNFTTQEKLKIIEIISKYKSTIRSKLNTLKAIQEKRKAWYTIAQIYNSEVWTYKRSAKQLKHCYESICRETKLKSHNNVEVPEALNPDDENSSIKTEEYECVLEITDPNIVDPNIKPEDQDSTEELDIATNMPSQNINSTLTSQQQEMIDDAVEDIMVRRSDRNTTFTERYHQQEMQFRQDEHDMDMQIKLQKLENERRICERIALETTMLRLENKVIMKSLRTLKLKF